MRPASIARSSSSPRSSRTSGSAERTGRRWTKLRTRVVPALKGSRKRLAVNVEARLSEPPELRHQLEETARAELIKAGADEKATTVTLLSAYKQGYSWLYDIVRPALAGKPVDAIRIKFAEIG